MYLFSSWTRSAWLYIGSWTWAHTHTQHSTATAIPWSEPSVLYATSTIEAMLGVVRNHKIPYQLSQFDMFARAVHSTILLYACMFTIEIDTRNAIA